MRYCFNVYTYIQAFIISNYIKVGFLVDLSNLEITLSDCHLTSNLEPLESFRPNEIRVFIGTDFP